jgi:hypothetical protein
MDKHTRECLGGLVERSITGQRRDRRAEPPRDQRGYPAQCWAVTMAPSWSATPWPIGPPDGSTCPSSRRVRPDAAFTRIIRSRVRDECLTINLFWSLTPTPPSSSRIEKPTTTSTAGTQPWAISRRPATLRSATTNENQTPLTPIGTIHGSRHVEALILRRQAGDQLANRVASVSERHSISRTEWHTLLHSTIEREEANCLF